MAGTESYPLFECEDSGEIGSKQFLTSEGCTNLKLLRCFRCQEPMLAGQARYTGSEHRGQFQHYSCRERDNAKLYRDLRNLPGKAREVGVLLADLRKRLKF